MFTTATSRQSKTDKKPRKARNKPKPAEAVTPKVASRPDTALTSEIVFPQEVAVTPEVTALTNEVTFPQEEAVMPEVASTPDAALLPEVAMDKGKYL